MSSDEARKLVAITPMLGINDFKNEVFTTEDAKEIVTYAITNNIGIQLLIISFKQEK